VVLTSGTIDGPRRGYEPFLRVRWQVQQQNIVDNTSKVNADLYLVSPENIQFSGNRDWSISVHPSGGTTRGTKYVSMYGSGFDKYIGTRTTWVEHKANGEIGDSRIEASMDINIWWYQSNRQIGTLSLEGSYNAPKINRRATITSASFRYVLDTGRNNTLYLDLSGSSSSHSHYISLYSGNTLIGEWNTGGNPSQLDINPTHVERIMNQMPNSTSKSFTLGVTSYIGGTELGTSYRNVTANIHSSVTPSIPTLSYNPTPGSEYIEGNSRVEASFSSTPSQGSSITSRRMELKGPNSGRQTFGSVSGDTVSGTSNTFSSSGNYTLSFTAVDSRGRSNTATRTISVRAYNSPNINNFKADRTGGMVEGQNLLVQEDFIQDKALTDSSGAPTSSPKNIDDGSMSGHIPTNGNSNITLSLSHGNYDYHTIAFYDANDNYIKSEQEHEGSNSPSTFDIPDNANYFVASASRQGLSRAKIEFGTVATAWSPGGEETINVRFGVDYDTLDGTNSIQYTVESQERGGSSVTELSSGVVTSGTLNYNEYFGGHAGNKAYVITVRITDDYGTSQSETTIVGTGKQLLTLNQDKGVGIGKYHEQGELDVQGNIFLTGNVHIIPEQVKDGVATSIFNARTLNPDGLGEITLSDGTDDSTLFRLGNYRQNWTTGFENYSSGDMQIGSHGGALLLNSSLGVFVNDSNSRKYQQIVFKGENDNGSYVRFYDGTQICWYKEHQVRYNNSDFMQANWYYPIEFVDDNVIVTGVKRAFWSSNRYNVANFSADGGSDKALLRVWAVEGSFSSGDNDYYNVMAIGRWK